MKYIDLTHTFTNNMPVYPGDPVSSLSQIAEVHADGFTDHMIKTGMHVGTHMDAPLHMIEGGKKISDLDPTVFFGEGVLLDVQDHAVIDADVLDGVSVAKGSIVLVFTGYAAKYGTVGYYENHPVMTEAFAQALIDRGVKMVGMDLPSPDRMPFPLHKLFLSREILLLENLTTMDSLVGLQHFSVIALPAKLYADAAPVRVLAVVA